MRERALVAEMLFLMADWLLATDGLPESRHEWVRLYERFRVLNDALQQALKADALKADASYQTPDASQGGEEQEQ